METINFIVKDLMLYLVLLRNANHPTKNAFAFWTDTNSFDKFNEKAILIIPGKIFCH